MSNTNSEALAPALDISDLKYRYPGGGSGECDHWVVNLPSLRIDRAEQVLLTGGSGVGKSTLLHLIAGLIDPTEGRINVAGRHMHALRGHDRDLYRGRTIGMIFQTFNLLHGFSALENVLAALMFSPIPKSEHRPRAEQLLKHLGITKLDAEPAKLSVGQQQRVAVARAVACSPALVLADEPTASLDPDNAAEAMNLIQRTCQEIGAALLCVSHDPAMATRFERRESLLELRASAART